MGIQARGYSDCPTAEDAFYGVFAVMRADLHPDTVERPVKIMNHLNWS